VAVSKGHVLRRARWGSGHNNLEDSWWDVGQLVNRELIIIVNGRSISNATNDAKPTERQNQN